MDYSVLAAYIGVFLLAEVIHELGHYLVGRICGFSCREFSIGMGPAILSIPLCGTRWKWRLLPLGSSCDLEDFSRPRKGEKLAKLRRLAVILAGPGMNLLLALGLLLAVGGDWDWVTALLNLDFAGTLDCVRDLFPLKMDRLWEYAGLISVCLAGFNLIPLPGFDGARALGMVFKKKV